jgi:peroxiredoxin Q/BCP
VAKIPSVGQGAPGFSLPGVRLAAGRPERREYSLSEHRGRPLVLAFYPGDDTAVCTRQLCAYSSGIDRFTALGAAVWGISPQSVDSHEDFARKHGLAMPLLADADLSVAEAYGVAVAGKGLRRAVFLLDAHGTVRWRHVAVLGLTYRRVDTLTEQLRMLEHAR